jgi:hypothetical protein
MNATSDALERHITAHASETTSDGSECLPGGCRAFSVAEQQMVNPQ